MVNEVMMMTKTMVLISTGMVRWRCSKYDDDDDFDGNYG